jgi:hypothetical protein
VLSSLIQNNITVIIAIGVLIGIFRISSYIPSLIILREMLETKSEHGTRISNVGTI